MKKTLFLTALAALATSAFAQFSEDYEARPLGDLSTNGWTGWDNDTSVLGNVTTAHAHSGTKSNQVRTNGTFSDYTDCVHPFSTFTSGKWVFQIYQFIPSAAALGDDSFVILMNKYTGLGSGYEWSVQLFANHATGMFQDYDLTLANQLPQPIVYGQWVPIHVYIDLTTTTNARGTVQEYYNCHRIDNIVGGLPKVWRPITYTAAGVLNLQNLDLYADASIGGGSDVYYDDLDISAAQKTYNATSVAVTDGSVFAGNLASISANDSNRYRFFNGDDLVGSVEFGTNTGLPSVSAFTFNLVHRVARTGLAYEVFFYDFTASDWVSQGGDEAPTADTSSSFAVNSGANAYNNCGEMKVHIDYQPINDEVPSQDGWLHDINLANWDVTAF